MAFPRPLASSWAGSGFHSNLFANSTTTHQPINKHKTHHHSLYPPAAKRISAQSLTQAPRTSAPAARL
ncbi:MAG: hypothetical protein LBQ31_10180 [Bacteroidales bacterium]|nr:hypothetical protein [Bacteroidales bacterium]